MQGTLFIHCWQRILCNNEARGINTSTSQLGIQPYNCQGSKNLPFTKLLYDSMLYLKAFYLNYKVRNHLEEQFLLYLKFFKILYYLSLKNSSSDNLKLWLSIEGTEGGTSKVKFQQAMFIAIIKLQFTTLLQSSNQWMTDLPPTQAIINKRFQLFCHTFPYTCSGN
jgi:hypothetical protein